MEVTAATVAAQGSLYFRRVRMLRSTVFALCILGNFGVAFGQWSGYNEPVVQQGQYYGGANTYQQDAPLYQQNVQVNQNTVPFNQGWRPGAVSPFPQIKRTENYHRHDHYHHQDSQYYQNYSHYYPQQQYVQPQVYYYPQTQCYWYYYYPTYNRYW